MKEWSIAFTDSKGEPLTIMFTEMTRDQNRQFGAKARAHALKEAENVAREFPSLRSAVENVVSSICSQGAEIPSRFGLEYAASPDGIRLLIQLLTLRCHPTPIDNETVDRLMQEKYVELNEHLAELLPIPKRVGATSPTPK